MVKTRELGLLIRFSDTYVPLTKTYQQKRLSLFELVLLLLFFLIYQFLVSYYK